MCRDAWYWLMASTNWGGFVGLAIMIGLPAGCGRPDRSPEPAEAPTKTSRKAEPSEPAGPQTYGYAALSDDQQKRAESLYSRHCSGCHGEKGDGLGLAARWLFPKPRDFTAGNFRLVSTADGMPTIEDLQTVLERGMPGSAMLPWPQLSDEELRLLAHRVIEFRREGIRERERELAEKFGEEVDPQQLHQLVVEQTTPGDPLEVPTLGPADEKSIDRGRTIYLERCASCHGKEGRGDGQEKMVDAKGLPTRPRDLTKGIFKGSPDPQSVFIRIHTGMPGSPMPGTRNLSDQQVADLTHFVLSLSDEATRAATVLNREQINVPLVTGLPQSPEDSFWNDVPTVSLRTTPLWWRDEYPERIEVQSVHDGNTLAIRLRWEDATHNPHEAVTQAFGDAVAVELFDGETEPFVGMGMAEANVDVWFWSADREPGTPRVEDVYPNTVVDQYPFTETVVENPDYDRPGTATDAQDPVTLPARAVGNQIVPGINPNAGSSLTGGGPGTVTFRPPVNQTVDVRGAWKDGTWTVVMTRQLRPQSAEAGIRLHPGQRLSAAFAVWDGARNDRDGQKVITIWQDLTLQEDP